MSTVFYFSVCKIPLSFFSAPETPEKNPPLCPYLWKINHMLEWLEARCSDTHLQQVFWEAHQRPHLLCAACLTGPTTICIPQKPFHRHAIAFTLHTALSHLENKNTYVRMLFVDYSSAFNTIVPATLVEKLQTLGLNRSLCSWILDFLTGRSQVVRMGNNTSSPLILNTGAPQGCVLSPLLYCLYTHDCTATHSSNVIVKFADDTTVIGLITDNDETAYREEVSTLTKWCQENHLSLNIDKTKELVVDFRRQSREHTPISIDKTPVERVNSFKFLCVHITEDLTWSAHTDAVLKKAHQRLFFLRRLRKFGTSPSILRSFYTCTVESILTGCITAWFGNSTAGNRKALQRVVRTARHIVGGELPSLQDIYTRRCIRKARRIIKDSSHPSHRLLSLLPSGRRLRSIRSRTSRLRDSFFPQAIRLMNSQN